ncbi:9185_t:CDS:1 [Dentiscutata erythropus]|uniref:9185_t:CDS:1 n=1 Tax=Dentiscutata erythropus TaxID=1348616 RepID=A0A9N9IEB8_9GLOM|nr:9185_t:CDS:1 [Dentiscutata erythropus]
MIPIPPLLLFSGLVVGFSILFTNTINKSGSDHSEKIEDRLFINETNEVSCPVLSKRTSFFIEKIFHLYNQNTKKKLKHKRSLIVKTSYNFQIITELFFHLFFGTILCERKTQNIYFNFIDNYNQPYKIRNNGIDQNIYSTLIYYRSNRTINNCLFQSLNFEVIKIIENSLFHHNQFYKVPPAKNLIIGLHYYSYSASYIEIECSKYLYSYSIIQSLQMTSTLKSEDYKTPNGNNVLEQDNSSNIKNIDSYLSYEFQSLRTTNMNDTFVININKINILNDTIKNIELQLKEIRDSVEERIRLSEEIIDIESIHQNLFDSTINISIGECNEFEILYLNKIRNDVAILKEGIAEFNIRFCGAYEIDEIIVKEVLYFLRNRIKFPGRLRI